MALKVLIEMIDSLVVKYIKEALEEKGEAFRMIILPDHPTPICTKTHARDAVPCLLYDSTKAENGENIFTEESAKGGEVIDPGYTLMNLLLNA